MLTITKGWWAVRPVGRVDFVGWTRDVALPIPEVAPPEGVSIRPATPAELPRLAEAMAPFHRLIPDFGRRRSLLGAFQERYQEGDFYLIADVHGQIVYMGWTRFDHASLPWMGLVVVLGSGEAYTYGVFAIPTHRAHGLATAVGAERLRWLQRQGARAVCAWADPDNMAILRVMERLGYRLVSRVSQIYWRLPRRVPLLNRVHFVANDPLAGWCSPQRLRFRSGITIFSPARIL